MSEVLYALKYIAISLIFLLPIFIIYWKFVFKSLKRSVVYLIFSMYTIAVFYLVGLPNVLYFRFDFTHNFVPFVEMKNSVAESLLNVLLFMPLGFFLPVFCKKYQKLLQTLLFGLFTTLGIELLQIFTFRASDINDIITNVSGTVIGYFLAMLITGKFKRCTFNENSGKKLYISFVTSFSAMFLLVPFISKAMGEFN